MPTPKSCCQNRLTATRAVNGCSRIDEPVRQVHPRGHAVVVLQRKQKARRVAGDFGAGLVVSSADQNIGRSWFGSLLHDHRRGKRDDVFIHGLAGGLHGRFRLLDGGFGLPLVLLVRGALQCCAAAGQFGLGGGDRGFAAIELGLLLWTCQVDVRRLQPSLEIGSTVARRFLVPRPGC